MQNAPRVDYSPLDQPEVVSRLFHPRPEWHASDRGGPSRDVLIPVEKDVVVGGRFHMADPRAPNILFFHGNGEIVADYDDLGPFYNRMGINFLPVDYRGYGRSTGSPTVTAMIHDSLLVFDFVKKWLGENGYVGPLVAMGRSLGSASVAEIAFKHEECLDALIIESGFAYAAPLLALLGVDAVSIGFKEEEGFRNLDKVRTFGKPLLIIHAEFDHIIPFSDGQALYDASQSKDKTLVKIRGANHNDIFARGLMEYMSAVKKLVEGLKAKQ